MRKVKFRGKRMDNDAWVYGYLIGEDAIVGEIVDWDSEYFCTEFWYKVDPETVGQYTGLKDNNGRKIYKGDIVRWSYSDGALPHWIEWSDINAGFAIVSDSEGHRMYEFDMSDLHEAELIGNIYDNPEIISA